MAYMKTIKKRTNTVSGGLTTSAARTEKFASKNAGKKLKVVAPITGSKIAKPLTKSIGSKLTTASAREEKFASNKKLAMNKVAKKR